MDKEFYDLAVKLMENIGQLEPNLVAARDAELCVLMAESQQIYAGITGVKISAGQLMRACPEYNAIMAMAAEGETRAEKLITVSFAQHEVSQPCDACLELLVRLDKENVNTQIYKDKSTTVKALELMPKLTEAADKPPVVVPAPNQAAAEEAAPAENAEKAAEGIPADVQQALEVALTNPLAGEAAAEEKKDEAPKDDFAKFGFEEGDFVDHVEIDEDNPFNESTAPPPPVTVATLASQQPSESSAFQPAPNLQGGQSQQSTSMYASQPLPGKGNSMYASQPLPGKANSMYASQPLPGQQRPAGPAFTPNNPSVIQPQQQGVSQQMPYGQQQPYGQQGDQQQMPQQQGDQQPNFNQQQAADGQSAGVQFQPGQEVHFQPNPKYNHSRQYSSQPMQSRPAPSQYASQPLPGSVYLNGAPASGQTVTGSAAPKEAGSAFKDRLNAFVEDTGVSDKGNNSPLSAAEMRKQAKEMKKNAKIDADFKKKLSKRGFSDQ